MADKQKLLIPGKVYHIYNHANGNDCLFRSEGNYGYFLEKYTYYISGGGDFRLLFIV